MTSPLSVAAFDVPFITVPYLDTVIGAAVFDLSGLPREYFIANESNDSGWVQSIFQALGLQTLLVASLQLDGFQHIVVHGRSYRAIVVRRKTCYTAILINQDSDQPPEALIQWAKEIELNDLRLDPRFTVV